MRLTGRPTLQTLAAIAAIFLVQQAVALLGWGGYALFVLDSSVTARPWTVVTHVYAHTTIGHLLSNAVGLAIAGPFVSRRTTTTRFHAFVVTSGALAGLSEVLLGGFVWGPTAVVGVSGALFALFGYLLTGNVVAAGVLDRLDLSRRAQIGLLVGVAILATVATASPRAALIGHAVGFAFGLVAGRLRLLDLSAPDIPAEHVERRY